MKKKVKIYYRNYLIVYFGLHICFFFLLSFSNKIWVNKKFILHAESTNANETRANRNDKMFCNGSNKFFIYLLEEYFQQKLFN